MASTLHEDIEAFVDDVLSTMTNLHVKAAQFHADPAVQAAFGDLASVPGALIEQAQQLRARLDDAGNGPFFTKSAKPKGVVTDMRESDEPKPKAKPAASTRRS